MNVYQIDNPNAILGAFLTVASDSVVYLRSDGTVGTIPIAQARLLPPSQKPQTMSDLVKHN